MPDTLADLRACFPVAEAWIYLNHAACAPLAVPVRDALVAFADECLRQGSADFAGWLARREEARALFAELIGAEPGEVAFVTSTSQGLLTVAEGLPLLPGDRLVVLEHDFPSNRIPWWRQQERRGVEVVVVPRDHDGRVTPEAIMARVDERTAVVAVSWVAYDNGQRLDVASLGAAIARRNAALEQAGRAPGEAELVAALAAGLAGRPSPGHAVPGSVSALPAPLRFPARRTLFCVDAIQGLGALALDVKAAQIDFASADSHKWLLGLEGIGALYVRRELVELLDPPLISWWSLAQPFAPWDPQAALHGDARRFEYAALPTQGIFGFHAALRLLHATGVERIEAAITRLTTQLAAGLTARGWRLLSPRERSAEWSGIVTAAPPGGIAAAEAARALVAAGVSVVARGGGVRFSPHGWNTAAEIEATLERLP